MGGGNISILKVTKKLISKTEMFYTKSVIFIFPSSLSTLFDSYRDSLKLGPNRIFLDLYINTVSNDIF